MNQTRTLTVEPVGEREIVIIRSLDAPRDLVFRAHTEPDLLRRWMGPRTWELTECDDRPARRRRVALRHARPRRGGDGDAGRVPRGVAARRGS